MDKKYDFQKSEKQLTNFWEENQIYKYGKGKERPV